MIVLCMQVLSPLLSQLVTAYTALMHCHRPLRFLDTSISPTENACAACITAPDSAAHGGRSMSNKAKAVFKFAREQLSQLGKLLGFQNVQDLYYAAGPTMLALAEGATAAHRVHGMHACGAQIESEAHAMTSHLDAVCCATLRCLLRSARCSVLCCALLSSCFHMSCPHCFLCADGVMCVSR